MRIFIIIIISIIFILIIRKHSENFSPSTVSQLKSRYPVKSSTPNAPDLLAKDLYMKDLKYKYDDILYFINKHD